MNRKRFKAAVAFVISMMMVSTVAIIGLFAALVGTTPTYAAPPQIIESEDYLPMVAFEGQELKKFGFSDVPQIMDTNSTPFISNHVWSPDGNWLAYVRIGENSNELILTDMLGRTVQVLATGLNSGLPIHFSKDSNQLFYALVPNPEQATSINAPYTVDVMTQVIGSPNSPAKLGSFEQASCGGASPTLYDMLYWAEAGTNGIRPMLAVTDFGIVHSITCEGIGVAILELSTGVDTPLDNEITHVSLSSDGKSLLGIKNNRIMIIDLITGQLLTSPVDATPDQVMWGAAETGNIYYSVRTVTDEMITYSPEQQQKILNATGLVVSHVAVNHVAIHRFNLETGNDEIVYDNAAYAIGHMSLLPDNRVLMVSEVPSLTDWFDTILESGNSDHSQLKTALYLVSLEGAETRLVGTGLTGARLNEDEYVRQFGLRPQLTAQPTSVSIGAQITLSGSNYPPQSHVSVYLGTDADNLDTVSYAAGFTNPQGEITLSFNMPARRENGQAIGNGQLMLVAKSSDGLFSAQTLVNVSINSTPTPLVPIVTRAPANPSVPTPFVPASISISPDRGTVGTQIRINGRNFPANRRVNIHLGSITTLTGNAVYASAFSDNNGNVTLTFNMPGVYANGTPIQASQILIVAATDDFVSNSGLFFNFIPITQPVVIPSISLSPTKIKTKEKLTVRGSHFPPNTTVNVLMGPDTNDLRGNYRTVITDGSGNFTTSFTVPERWKDSGKIKSKQVVIVAAPYPSGTWSNFATLRIEERKKNPNTPTPTPTVIPTDEPTDVPTLEVPTEEPTAEPTAEVPTEEPTIEVPTEEPTAEPTVEVPTDEPTEEPTLDDEPYIPQQPIPQEPVVQQPTPAPVIQEPVVQQPTPAPVIQEPVVQEPVPVIQEPVVQEPVPQEPIIQQPEPVVQNPVVQITPGSVMIGSSFTVSGNHFPANAVVTVRLVGAVTTSLGLVNTDGDGSFTATLTVPWQIEDTQPMVAGNYQVIVGNSEVSASSTIAVTG